MLYPNRLLSFILGKYDRLKQRHLHTKFKSCASDVFFGRVELLLGPQYIQIGTGTCFGDGLFLTAWDSYPSYDGIQDLGIPDIQIGSNCNFGAYNHITCANSIHIGNGLLTGKWVTISDNSHGESDFNTLQIPPHKRKIVSKGPVIIEDNVWIGEKVTILSGVTIGEGAIIAANAVVTKNVPAFSVVAGIPARIIKEAKQQ